VSQDRPGRLLALARNIIADRPDFHVVKGPGAGDKATAAFMRELRARAIAEFNEDYSERRICGKTSLCVDFYFPEEATVVEVALGLPNPGSEFEKDILKAIIAHDYGHPVQRLFFISRAGAVKKCSQPGRSTLIAWAASIHGLNIEIHELGGSPRVRNRRERSR
jgi:hypothetical protein